MVPGREKGKTAKIKGLIVPYAWDEKGDVLEIVIDTLDERRYHIESDETGVSLVHFIRTVVEVTGWLYRDSFGRQAISVEAYETERERGTAENIGEDQERFAPYK